MPLPDSGSYSCGKVSVYVKGTPIAAVVCPAGVCLSILSTAVKRFEHLRICWRVIEPLTNQTKSLCAWLSHDMLPTKSTLLKMSSVFDTLNQLILPPYGLDAGKFSMVQSPSICNSVGGVGLTKPLSVPP